MRERDDLTPQLRDVPPDLADVPADAGADLDDRLVHLGLDAFLQDQLALVEHLLDVRAQLPRLRIDDLEFLLDAEGEGGALDRHGPSYSTDGSAVSRRRDFARARGFFGLSVSGVVEATSSRAFCHSHARDGRGPSATRSMSHVADCSTIHSKFVRADGRDVRVRRGVQEVDRVRDSVADRQLDRVELVAESAGQLQAVAPQALLERRLDRYFRADVPVLVRLSRVVSHDPDVLRPRA